ncbi:MAG: ThuA domain-containing protein [Pseudomonadota bacterium]
MSGSSAIPYKRRDVHLVVGGKSHDFDYVRMELLRRLGAHDHLRVSVDSTYADLDRLAECDVLITYTCDLAPAPEQESKVRDFVTRGGRWLCLHATNSLLAWTEKGVASRHTRSPWFETIGSAFVAHPLIEPFTVEVTKDHPLTRGIQPFEVTDELYLYEMFSDPEVLLHTVYHGDAPGFVESDWSDGDGIRPVMYINRVGEGAVLFLALGHARGHYDAPHRTPFYPRVERGAWTTPEFDTLLERSLEWVLGEHTALTPEEMRPPQYA